MIPHLARTGRASIRARVRKFTPAEYQPSINGRDVDVSVQVDGSIQRDGKSHRGAFGCAIPRGRAG